MSLKYSIGVLSATKPPGKRWRYISAGKGNARIAELEKQLGIEPSRPIFRMSDMNERINELENKISAKPSMSAPVEDPPIPRPVELTGDATTDNAIKNSGVRSLSALKAKARRDQLFATAMSLPPGSLARQCAEANLAQAQTNLKNES